MLYNTFYAKICSIQCRRWIGTHYKYLQAGETSSLRIIYLGDDLISESGSRHCQSLCRAAWLVSESITSSRCVSVSHTHTHTYIYVSTKNVSTNSNMFLFSLSVSDSNVVAVKHKNRNWKCSWVFLNLSYFLFMFYYLKYSITISDIHSCQGCMLLIVR